MNRRKKRTTITHSKVSLLNCLFKEFKLNNQTKNITLKQIANQTNLAYSTILRKFREFEELKEVPKGILLTCSNRKYKKSKDLKIILGEAIRNRPFFTIC